MRVLVASTANDGHFGPLVPIARALTSAGHEVRVAAPESYAAAVASAGYVHEPFPDVPPEVIGPVMARLPTLSFEEANATVIREVFARIDAQAALPGLVRTLDSWRPDLVLREPAELGSLAAAEQAGIPHAQVAIGMQEVVTLFAELTEEPLAELGALAGVPAERLVAAYRSAPQLSQVPERLDRAGDPAFADGWPVSRFRLDEPPRETGTLPAWGDPEHPLVYVTFGSVTGSLPPFAGVFREALDALADRPVRVLMTVGRRVDIDGLGPLPANAHVEPWWPQPDALARATAVIGHGGFGTTMGAVAAGLPQVVAPIFTSDQAVNARHVAAAGAGVGCSPGPSVVSQACAALDDLLADPSYAAAARALAADLAALPPPSDAVPVLEELAAS